MERFREWEDKGKQCILLYCGDHDPSGLSISDAYIEELQDAVEWDPGRLIIRFGLNADFIKANNLTWIDNLETGSGSDLSNPGHHDHAKPYVQNYLQRFGPRKVEANALVVRAGQGRRLCRDSILKYIDKEGVGGYQADLAVAREEAREAIREKLENWS
jgi:hypothetical protein